MQSLCQELVRFINSINPKELKRNLKLKRKVMALLRCLNEVYPSGEMVKMLDRQKYNEHFYKDIM